MAIITCPRCGGSGQEPTLAEPVAKLIHILEEEGATEECKAEDLATLRQDIMIRAAPFISPPCRFCKGAKKVEIDERELESCLKGKAQLLGENYQAPLELKEA